jgi:hypothetical protein
LIFLEGANRLRAVRVSRHRPKGESRRLPDNRMLWICTALMRFAHFPTINSVLSNTGELRRQSRHVVVFPMENRLSMTRPDGDSELPHSNEGCKETQCSTPRTPPARGRQSLSSNKEVQLNYNDTAWRAPELTCIGTNTFYGREGANRLRARRFIPHRTDGESLRLPDVRMLWR